MFPHIRKQAVFAATGMILLVSAIVYVPMHGQAAAVNQPAAAVNQPAMNQPAVQAAQVTQPTPVSPVPVYARTITVSGAGTAQAAPDIAYIDLGVTTDAKTARDALTQNNTQMQSLMTALESAGIASADIKTQGIQIYPRYNTNPPPPPSQPNTTQATPEANPLLGFTASNTVEVTVRKIGSLGQILDQAVSAGSNQVQGIRFDVSNPAQVMDQARQAAMQDASHRAGQLAALSNGKLGVVITVNEQSSSPIPYQASAGIAARAESAVPVSPGTQTVTVNLTVTWELQ